MNVKKIAEILKHRYNWDQYSKLPEVNKLIEEYKKVFKDKSLFRYKEKETKLNPLSKKIDKVIEKHLEEEKKIINKISIQVLSEKREEYPGMSEIKGEIQDPLEKKKLRKLLDSIEDFEFCWMDEVTPTRNGPGTDYWEDNIKDDEKVKKLFLDLKDQDIAKKIYRIYTFEKNDGRYNRWTKNK